MNGKKWIIGAICAAALPLAALAQGHSGADGMGGHFHGMHSPDAQLLQGVTLSDAQQTQIQQIHQAGWAQAKPLMQQLHSTESQIRDLFLAPGAVDTAKLTTLRQQASSLHQQLDDMRLNAMLQVRAALTPAQIAQAASNRTQMESLHQQMRNLTHPGAASSTNN
jgi:Spy/CpxP family protein refolding chaperone